MYARSARVRSITALRGSARVRRRSLRGVVERRVLRQEHLSSEGAEAAYRRCQDDQVGRERLHTQAHVEEQEEGEGVRCQADPPPTLTPLGEYPLPEQLGGRNGQNTTSVNGFEPSCEIRSRVQPFASEECWRAIRAGLRSTRCCPASGLRRQFCRP